MKALIVVAALLALEGVANARLTMGVFNSANSGGGGVAPACTPGVLDLSCNSIFIAVLR